MSHTQKSIHVYEKTRNNIKTQHNNILYIFINWPSSLLAMQTKDWNNQLPFGMSTALVSPRSVQCSNPSKHEFFQAFFSQLSIQLWWSSLHLWNHNIFTKQLQALSFCYDQQRSSEHTQQVLLKPKFRHKIPPSLFASGQEPVKNRKKRKSIFS